MLETFKGFPKWLQYVLLAIPMCNWIVEVVIRVTQFIANKSTQNLVMMIVSFVFGTLLGWVDLVMLIVSGDLLLIDG